MEKILCDDCRAEIKNFDLKWNVIGDRVVCESCYEERIKEILNDAIRFFKSQKYTIDDISDLIDCSGDYENFVVIRKKNGKHLIKLDYCDYIKVELDL